MGSKLNRSARAEVGEVGEGDRGVGVGEGEFKEEKRSPLPGVTSTGGGRLREAKPSICLLILEVEGEGLDRGVRPVPAPGVGVGVKERGRVAGVLDFFSASWRREERRLVEASFAALCSCKAEAVFRLFIAVTVSAKEKGVEEEEAGEPMRGTEEE